MILWRHISDLIKLSCTLSCVNHILKGQGLVNGICIISVPQAREIKELLIRFRECAEVVARVLYCGSLRFIETFLKLV